MTKLLALFILLTAGVASAQPKGDNPGPGPGPGRGPGPGHGPGMTPPPGPPRHGPGGGPMGHMGPMGPRHHDPIHDKLYPPELIMEHQQELGIDDKQRAAIVREIQQSQGRIVELQWQMQGSVEQLVKLLDAAPVDEARALAQADKVMGLERELKKAHLTLLVRVKNLLTDGQRAKVKDLRAKRLR